MRRRFMAHRYVADQDSDSLSKSSIPVDIAPSVDLGVTVFIA